jgi:3-hydroxyisobutyrate dehydrogenase-like beta-hydroxyacid dehydrogenase
MDEIGFIGLGAMGGQMLRHLAKTGFKVYVFDTNPAAIALAEEHGAVALPSAAAVGDAVEVVLICLPTPEIVRRVVLGPGGIIEGSKVRIYADHSTTGPSIAREVAEKLAEPQIVALDAPLAGGVTGAETGTLSVMVSGQSWAYEKVERAFHSFGRNVVHVGEGVGQGQVLKLVNNMIVATNLLVASEAILFGVKAGLSAEVILKMLNVSTARSFVTENILEGRILDRRFDFGFRLELIRKDMRLSVSEADAAGAPLIINALAKQFYELAHAHGAGMEDMTAVVQELEKAAGVTIARS